MPPAIASLVFWAFIIWLIYRDSKNATTSPGLWLSTISLSIMASKPVVYWLYGGQVGDISGYDDDAMGGNATDRTVLLILFFLAIGTLVRRRIRLSDVISENLALSLLVLFMFCSIVWAVDPFIAFKRYIREVGHLVMILVVLTDKNPTEAVRRVLARVTYVLVPLSVLYVKYYPESGRYYTRWTWTTMYSGVTTNKNALGLLAMLGALVMLWIIVDMRSKKRPKVDMIGEVIVLVMSVWLLTIANSKTALMCFYIATFSFFGCRTKWVWAKPARLTASMWAILVISAILLMSPVSRGLVAESMGRDPSLTTRTDIWAAALGLKTNFLIGAGYNSVWLTDGGRELAEKLEVPHSHNGYLETYLNLGIIGAGLLIIVLLSACRNAAKQISLGSPLGPFLVAICLSGIIYNYSEVAFGRDSSVSFCLMLAAIRVTQLSGVRASLPSVVPAFRLALGAQSAPAFGRRPADPAGSRGR